MFFILSQYLKMFSGLFLNLLLECINSSEKLILLIQKLSISNFINDIKNQYLNIFNTEEECKIIAKHFVVLKNHIDLQSKIYN